MPQDNELQLNLLLQSIEIGMLKAGVEDKKQQL